MTYVESMIPCTYVSCHVRSVRSTAFIGITFTQLRSASNPFILAPFSL